MGAESCRVRSGEASGRVQFVAMCNHLRVIARRIAAGLLTAGWLTGCEPAEMPAQVIRPSLFETTVLASPRLSETSGIAVSRRLHGTLWTHNDSGDDPVLYATDLQGADRGMVRVRGATAVDWEDLALGPCPDAESACLFIGDVGDNSETRATVDLFVLREPDAVPDSTSLFPLSVPARRIRLRYKEGPQNVEAIAVTASGAVLLITKGRSGPVSLYRIPRTALLGDSLTIQRERTLDIVPQRSFGRQVTGAAVSPDGTLLVLRTYTELIFYRLDGAEQPTKAGSCWLGLREPQGEAVDFLDDNTLVLTSEAAFGLPATISRVRCPLP